MLNPTDTKVDLIVNKLTEEQFSQLSADGRLDENQLWFVAPEEQQYMVLGQGGGATIHDIHRENLSPDVPDNLTFVALEDNSTVGMAKSGSAPSVSLEYSTDNG